MFSYNNLIWKKIKASSCTPKAPSSKIYCFKYFASINYEFIMLGTRLKSLKSFLINARISWRYISPLMRMLASIFRGNRQKLLLYQEQKHHLKPFLLAQPASKQTHKFYAHQNFPLLCLLSPFMLHRFAGFPNFVTTSPLYVVIASLVSNKKSRSWFSGRRSSIIPHLR